MKKSGWDYFTPDARTVDSINCPTCGIPMSVSRDSDVPIPLRPYPYDLFECKNAEIEMHQQARDLMGLSQDTPSPTLSAIYRGDAEDILQTAKFS